MLLPITPRTHRHPMPKLKSSPEGSLVLTLAVFLCFPLPVLKQDTISPLPLQVRPAPL